MSAEPIILGPVAFSHLPPAWKEVVDQTKPWETRPEETLWFAALVNNRVAGVGGLAMHWPHPGTAWVGPSLVLPDYRGQGLQKLLLQARVASGKAKGADTLVTAVDITNSASLRNLLLSGFRVTGYDRHHDHLEMAHGD